MIWVVDFEVVALKYNLGEGATAAIDELPLFHFPVFQQLTSSNIEAREWAVSPLFRFRFRKW